MSYIEYEKAQKLGLKAHKVAVSKGEDEYLPVLDEILDGIEIIKEVNLGLVQVPLDRVVGTGTKGRTTAFANNFMPIFDYNTEFGAKWSSLCDSHISEGIREPIKVYEYMNKFYVVEGNKRVSVLKYFGAVSVPAMVTRKVPKLTDDSDIRLYYEFIEFNALTDINYLWFEQEGCFNRLLELTSDDPTKPWDDDQKMDFASTNHKFKTVLKKCGGDKLPLTTEEALLIYIDIYGYEEIKNLSPLEMEEKVKLLWDEFIIESNGRAVELRMEPAKTGRKKLMDYFFSPNQKTTTVAFVFDKKPEDSEWLYGHELGRLYLEEHCSDKIKTLKVHGLNSKEETIAAMEDLVAQGVDIIFTTSSQQISESLKVAVDHPNVVVLNCSLNTSHKAIRTYYARLYEVKFLAGMIAGALADNGKIGYLADYPIFGMPANINAFALGTQMVNPKAKVYLEWTTLKGVSREIAIQHFKDNGINYISDQVMIKPNNAGRQFGLYSIEGDETVNIAMPVYQWGVFYSKLIDSIVNGTFKNEDEEKAINYWWGLSAEVVDIIYSQKLPQGTKRLIDTIKELILNNKFSPFKGSIMAQGNVIKNAADEELSPEEIMKMNWLVDNIIGEIPEIDDLKDEARAIVELKGVVEETG